MRIARVIGTVTLNSRLPGFKPGRLLIADALDGQALEGFAQTGHLTARKAPMPESLVVYDELGAGVGQIIAVSEGREASMPFYPEKVPVDAYNAAILDEVEITRRAPQKVSA
ncbi:MAG: EutN/CcmL family microcompartment protein [Phycisphaeraceae bacterium]